MPWMSAKLLGATCGAIYEKNLVSDNIDLCLMQLHKKWKGRKY